MNITKAQKEIFNAMLSGERVRKFEVNETSVFITPNGYSGYVIPYSQVQINLAKIADFAGLDLQSVVKEENLCKLTNEAVIRQFPRKILRKLQRGDESIYFDEKLAVCFQNPKFYNAHKHQMIVVTEDISATRLNEIVGIILPSRVGEEYCNGGETNVKS